jgi:gas vesicle protein
MEILPSISPAVGAITAALIGGTISFISMMLSKDQKTTEYRQNWIDMLRNDISDFVALFSTITSYEIIAFGKSKKQGDAFVEESQEDWYKLNRLASNIQLRLNPELHKELIQHILDATNLAADTNAETRTLEQIALMETQIISASQTVLKDEWQRVKRGEWSFFITKWTALLFVLVGGLFFALR